MRAARWLVGGMDREGRRRFAIAERSVPSEAVIALRTAGFEVDVAPDLTDEVGHAHAIHVASDGTLEAATDPRADGSAAAG